ncbi:UDP-N-acetylmuramate--L-alanine ligase [Kiritimatiellaeota bacterium B1221]|nr:UDP-N-acetylmuramate--L-alanine ligase [Kiritimatiellaeota bacterium B1221]
MADPISDLLSKPGRVHFIGIGGIGMAGLARLLLQSGFEVSGSDQQVNRLTESLARQGVKIYQGHHPDQVRDLPLWAIRTPALGEGNPELDFLRAHQIPVMTRGQVLAAYSRARTCIAVAGAHGKTTTTSMLASLLWSAGEGAGYAVGGETQLPGLVADVGNGKSLVVEADESDGTLVYYRPRIGFLTHVEWDHIERFRSEDSLLQCYRKFVQRCGEIWIREGDALAEKVCAGHPQVRRIGESPEAGLRLKSIEQNAQGQRIHVQWNTENTCFHIPLPGKHNAWNGLMALAGALSLGVPLGKACMALSQFQGVARRFQKVEKNGVLLIQDYAHHPTEIQAVMASAQALEAKRIWVVFQPHRFSRTRHLLDDFVSSFAGADRLALLPVYAASEHSSQGVGSDLLAEKCRQKYGEVAVFSDRNALVETWGPELRPGDVVLIVGAGDIEALQVELADVL